ncbi:MAG: DNA gyrase modulator, partial [Cyanobacteria bacterium J06626_26]
MFKFLSDVVTNATVSADWIGIRAVKDIAKACAIRDAHPERNTQQFDQGAMVEVLAQGQFGYSATNNLSAASLAAAIVSAYGQAIAASQWAVHRFTT